MNERIKELAEKVGSTHKQNLGVYQFYPDELQKFFKYAYDEGYEDGISWRDYEDYDPENVK